MTFLSEPVPKSRRIESRGAHGGFLSKTCVVRGRSGSYDGTFYMPIDDEGAISMLAYRN